MYFSGQLTVDPNDITEILQARPTKGFFRLARQISQDVEDKTAERETFAAVTILQRLNMALRSAGVTNVVHLSRDGVLIYDDREGVDDDFKAALIAFGKQAAAKSRKSFQVLTLVLEHSGELLDYLIEIEVTKMHRVGESPIRITVNGVFREFISEDGQLTLASRTRLSSLVKDQAWHDAAKSAASEEFELFLDGLDAACQTHLHADHLSRSFRARILRPGNEQNRESAQTHYHDHYYHDPLFYDDYHWRSRSDYVWHWSEECERHECRISDCEIVDESGTVLTDCGSAESVMSEEGVVAVNEHNNEAADVEVEPDVSGSDAATEIDGAAAVDAEMTNVDLTGENLSAPESFGGWLSSVFGFDGGGDGGGWGGDGDSGGDGGGGDGGGGCGGCGGGE